MDPLLDLLSTMWAELRQARGQIAQKDQIIETLRSAQEVPPEPPLDKSE